MKSSRKEAESLGKLDDVFAEMGEDERKRALDWLRAKYVPNAQLPDKNAVTKKMQPPWVDEARHVLSKLPPLQPFDCQPKVFC